MAKKDTEKIVIDFDKVFEEIRIPEEMKIANIFAELHFEKGETPQELLKHVPNPYRVTYQEYLQWLRDNNISHYRFQ